MELHLKIRRQEEEEDGATLDPKAEDEENEASITGADKEREAESLPRVLKVRARRHRINRRRGGAAGLARRRGSSSGRRVAGLLLRPIWSDLQLLPRAIWSCC